MQEEKFKKYKYEAVRTVVYYKRNSNKKEGHISNEIVPACICQCKSCDYQCAKIGFGDMELYPNVRLKNDQ